MSVPLPPGLASLAALPENLFSLVVTHSLGSLLPRAGYVLDWLASVDEGLVPPSGTWLGSSTERRIRQLLVRSGALGYCKQTPEVAQAVAQDILLVLEQVELSWPATAALLTHSGIPAIRSEQQARARHTRCELNKLAEQWQHRVLLWQTLQKVAEELGIAPAIGTETDCGQLRDRAWFDLLRLQQWVAQIQQLQRLLALLGQQRPDPEQSATLSKLQQQMSPREQGPLQRILPGIPMETQGITRSDDLARMLPLEAAFMGHSMLNLLWHARRAEQGLLSYAVAGVMPINAGNDWPSPRTDQGTGQGQGLRHGPLILCLDTSASMHGLAEQVSKAMVLEALRLAKKQHRSCLVYLFGGEGELLTLDNQRLTLPELLDMLRGSFSGGTDVSTPLTAALQRLRRQEWQQADILLVSDGEFQVSAELHQMVAKAKERRGVRLFGLQLGYATALHAIRQLCEPVHLFNDWRSLEQAANQV
ncbi:vWA domain-containing protein [Zobellella aerophila]|uniref:VWFA domain-containing protein n=1 Tax=Zobellella aerophila TaxID=870480 RepID=A0ABP6UYC1_9GAMM